MNNTLQLKGVFEQKKNDSKPGSPNLPKDKSVKIEQLEKIFDDLIKIDEFWKNQNILPGVLISVYYNKVAAKSNRVQGLLSNASIKGAKFSNDKSPKHIITHHISSAMLQKSIQDLSVCIKIIREQFNGIVSHNTLEEINAGKIIIRNSLIKKSPFARIIVDTYYVEKFDILVEDVDLM